MRDDSHASPEAGAGTKGTVARVEGVTEIRLESNDPNPWKTLVESLGGEVLHIGVDAEPAVLDPLAPFCTN